MVNLYVYLVYLFLLLKSCILSQHIEDLTQEKFSLKRALDTSKSLADSLAIDNSSLTDSFNQQVVFLNFMAIACDLFQV